MVRRCISGVLLVSAACTPFATAPTSAADAGADAAAEASITEDAGTPGREDAGSDARSTPCSSSHFFCEDFDGPVAWPRWTRVEYQGSPIVADTGSFVSPATSMRVTIAGELLISNHPSYLHRSFPAAQHIVVNAEVAVSLSTNPPPTGEIDVIALELVPPPGFSRYFAALVATGDGQWVLESNAAKSDTDTIGNRAPIGAVGSGFQKVTLDLDLTNGSLRGSVAGAVGLGEVPVAQGGGHRLAIGASWANNAGGSYSVNIDDVVIDQ